METLVKTLKANVNVDIPKLGVLPVSLNNLANYVSNIQLYSTQNFKVKCISGTLYKGDTLQTIELSAGEEKSYIGSIYFFLAGNSSANIEIENMYVVNALKLNGLPFNSYVRVSQFSKYTKLASIVINTNLFVGKLEEYIMEASKYGKTSNITIESTWVRFGANSQLYGIVYFCDFATDNNVVTIKNTNASGAVLGTYNKTTGVWTYA